MISDHESCDSHMNHENLHCTLIQVCWCGCNLVPRLHNVIYLAWGGPGDSEIVFLFWHDCWSWACKPRQLLQCPPLMLFRGKWGLGMRLWAIVYFWPTVSITVTKYAAEIEKLVFEFSGSFICFCHLCSSYHRHLCVHVPDTCTCMQVPPTL